MKLMECHLIYPSFGGERQPDDLATMAKIFARHLCDAPAEVIDRAFDYHIRTSNKFPVVSDIAAALALVTVYQMNNGPDGWGALYSSDHPYVREQVKLGVNIGNHAKSVRAFEHGPFAIAARNAPAIERGRDAAPEPRSGSSGFRRIGVALKPLPATSR